MKRSKKTTSDSRPLSSKQQLECMIDSVPRIISAEGESIGRQEITPLSRRLDLPTIAPDGSLCSDADISLGR